jgi:hypothetical protein
MPGMISGPNWARRYGPSHRRLCTRPGCGAPAAATLRFQPTRREAWLVPLDETRTEGDLCARHAAGLVLPRGWRLHNDLAADRDDTVIPPPPVRRARGAAIARARRRRAATTAVELPGMSAATDSEPEARLGAAAEPEPAFAGDGEPGSPPLVAEASPETNEALVETLDAQTPLLRRAFTNVRRPEENS